MSFDKLKEYLPYREKNILSLNRLVIIAGI